MSSAWAKTGWRLGGATGGGVEGTGCLLQKTENLHSAIAGFRMLWVPQRGYGCSFFESTVIRSPEELRSSLRRLRAKRERWHSTPLPESYRTFSRALSAAEVDFKQEALVVLRCRAGSGTFVVSLSEARVRAGVLVATVKLSNNMGLSDASIAFHCFAIAVRKDSIKEVELREPLGKQVLPVTTE